MEFLFVSTTQLPDEAKVGYIGSYMSSGERVEYGSVDSYDLYNCVCALGVD